MDLKSSRPFVTAFGFEKQLGGFIFLLPGKEITIEGANEILLPLLTQCNGFNTAEKIIASVNVSTGYEIQEIEQTIATLFDYQILVDARECYEIFHRLSANPMSFSCESSNEDLAAMLRGESHLVQISHSHHTQLEALFEFRASTRRFSGETLSQEEFLRLAWAVYGKIERSKTFPESTIGLGTVPSGGALYPLRLYGIALKVSSLQENGVYRFNSQGISFLRSSNAEELALIFGEHPVSFNIENIAGIFVLAGLIGVRPSL